MANKALSFDGIDDKVIIPDSASLSAIGIMSVEAWVKIDALADHEGIISKEDGVGENREWLMRLTRDDQLSLSLYSADIDNYLYATGTTDVADGGWHYVVATWDGVNAAGHIKLWVDGSEEVLTTDVKAGTGYVAHDTAIDVEIGRYWHENQYTWSGLIDEVRISDKMRTQAEIEAIWNGGSGIRMEVDGNTLALWHIDEDNGTIFDETVNNNDGTIDGASWVTGYPFPIFVPRVAII